MYMLYGIYIYTSSKYGQIDQIDKQVISRHVVFSLVHTCLYDFTRQILVAVHRLKLINVVADGDKTLSRASILM